MPQLLHYLHIDKKTTMMPAQVLEQQQQAAGDRKDVLFLNSANEDIDWGTIDVYTCTNSCQASSTTAGGYVEEYVYLQPPPRSGPVIVKPELPEHTTKDASDGNNLVSIQEEEDA